MSESTHRTRSNAQTVGRDRSTARTDGQTRAGGAWLAVGSLLFVVGIVVHPQPSSDPAAFMATIAADPLRWAVAHWVTAIALAAFVVASLIVLTAGSRLTRHWWTLSAWATLIVGALWVTTAAVTEATAVTRAAVAGETATFETWQAFAGAYSTAFVAFALAIAVIAGGEARSVHGATPAWAAWIGALAGVAGVVGYVLGFGLGVAAGGPIWLASTVVMGLWSLWFGGSLARGSGAAVTRPEETGAGGKGAVP